MALQSLAIIFDDRHRPDTTGVYCLRALKKLLRVEHFLPDDLARIPRHGFDLYLSIDDGLEYHLPSDLHPCAWWAIDTHLNWEWYPKRAQDFAFIFAAQRDGTERLQQAGFNQAFWLPLACDPDIHRKHTVAKAYDICFVGHLFPGPRTESVELIQLHYPNSFVGQRFFEEMARVYSASRIVFNRSLRNDINMRVFEALACGSLLLTNDLEENGLASLFRDGVHYAVYRDSDELLEKIGYYLSHETEREQIAATGRAEVLARDTYPHRMQLLLSEVERMLAKKSRIALRPVPQPGVKAFEHKVLDSATDALGLTSIIILTHNELAYTKKCLESIRHFTDEPYELIVVDNASTDGTREFLQSQSDIKLVANSENRGYPAANNQGIRIATGRQILLLNNDTVVTTEWLKRLLTTLQSDPAIGLVGPCSNFVSGHQEISVSYGDDLVGLEEFAWNWGNTHTGQIVKTTRLVGFCLLFRRELVDKIGLLDERFGLGCFEDDDYCRRAMQAGFQAVIAQDAFVHHFGHRTFKATGVNFAELMQENQERYREKWQSQKNSVGTDAKPAIRFTAKSSPHGGLLLEAKPIILSLCMIVRDNARTIEPALNSIRPWVDEMVVVDTGSKDETPSLVKKLGARLYHFPWCDSFAVARNESLKYAEGQWIFWMDSDDTISPENGRKLRNLAHSTQDSSILGYVMQVHCPGSGEIGELSVTVVDHVKLIRNHPEIRFEGRIHEQVLPAIRRLGGLTAWSDVYVVHTGYDHSPTGQEKKRKRDLHLLHMELDEQPSHPFTLFNLGMTYSDIENHDRAIGYLSKSIECSGEGESHLRKAYALLVHCHSQLGHGNKAWEVCQTGLRHFPEDAELRFRSGLLLHELGRLDEAAQTYLGVLDKPGPRHFASIDHGIQGYKTRHNLAIVYMDMENWTRAEEQWRLIVSQVPRYQPGWRGLGEVLRRREKWNEATKLAQQMTKNSDLRCDGLGLMGQIALARGDLATARKRFQDAIKEFPNEAEARQNWCQFLFENGESAETATALRDLVHLQPNDAAAYHNLGSVYLRDNRLDEAIAAYERSLELRPASVGTLRILAKAFRQSGREKEEANTWNEVLQLVPDDSEATKALALTVSRSSVNELAKAFPWPEMAPAVEIPPDNVGWLGDGARTLLSQVLSNEMIIVLELGAWLGLSTRFIADHAPGAMVITIDHWRGSPEHLQHPKWQTMLPVLYEAFLKTNWSYRHRIIPIRMTTLEGINVVATYGLSPDVVYIDADHSYESVSKEIECCHQFFPDAVLVGDDFAAPGVRQAVTEFAQKQNLLLETTGDWPAWKLVRSPASKPR